MKRILSLVLTALVILMPLNMSFANVVNNVSGNNNIIIFNDVPSNHWASKEIQYFAGEKIVNGNGNGNFSPDEGVSREAFAKMLVLSFNAPQIAPITPTFSDLNPGDWAYSFVETCKEFLTGYNNPFGGKPAFHGAEFAAREDIAVALVRMMGYTKNDVKDSHAAENRFFDADEISPSLLPYINIAVEKKIIGGYPDGSFAPNKGISRAEAVVLLNRATKQAYSDINSDVVLTASITKGEKPADSILKIKSEAGTKVTVNGDVVAMTVDRNGDLVGTVNHRFAAEGEKVFVVVGTKGAKVKTLTLTAKYEVSAPELKITDCPTVSTKKEVTIRGTMFDQKETVLLTINGKFVDRTWRADSKDSWSETLLLKEGQNTFEIALTNLSGKVVKETKTILYQVGLPVLTFTECPTQVATNKVTIRGTMVDRNYTVKLTVNGEAVDETWTSNNTKLWSESVVLKEGDNTFEFVLTNAIGKVIKEIKTIKYVMDAPTLKILECPTEVAVPTVKVNGTMYDKNYTSKLTINGKLVESTWTANQAKQWSETLALKDGENKFEFVLTNTAGKVTKETRTILYKTALPEVIFLNCPELTQEKALQIQGRIANFVEGTKVYINDKEALISGNNHEFSFAVNLVDGDNYYVIRAVNKTGQAVTINKTIKLAPLASPTLILAPLAETVNEASLVVTGSVQDLWDNAVVLTINNVVVAIKDGKFTTTLTLVEGSNVVTIVAKNKYNLKSTVQKTVIYKVVPVIITPPTTTGSAITVPKTP